MKVEHGRGGEDLWFGPVPEPGSVEETRWLSAVLFAAREQISMWGDVIEARAGVRDVHTDSVRNSVDAYRAKRGWSPHGYGGEE